MANIKLKDIDSVEQTYTGITVLRIPNSDSGFTEFNYNGDATAVASDVLASKIAYTSTGQITGTIATKTKSDITVADNTATIPVGYYATAPTVAASELVSGSETKTSNGTYDVTNLASLVVAIPVYSDLS